MNGWELGGSAGSTTEEDRMEKLEPVIQEITVPQRESLNACVPSCYCCLDKGKIQYCFSSDGTTPCIQNDYENERFHRDHWEAYV